MSAMLNAYDYIKRCEPIAERMPEKDRRITTMGEIAIAKALLAVAEAIEHAAEVVKP